MDYRAVESRFSRRPQKNGPLQPHEYFSPRNSRRVRLRTNLEIYGIASSGRPGDPGADVKTQTLDADVADLHYRGYSVIDARRRRSGSPDYYKMLGSKQRWRD